MSDERSIQIATEFVHAADLSGLPHSRRFAAEAPPPFLPDASKDQSLVVGSQIVAFTKGVSDESRQAIANSALLAQLVANKQVPEQTQIDNWYESYFNALTNIGWVLQQKSFATYEASNDDVDVKEAILSVAAGLLGGPATTAYGIVKVALEAMTKGEENNPWIRLFARESQHSNAGRFQVSLVTGDAGGGFLVSMMAFSLRATSTLTQVLFIKVKRELAEFRQYSGAVSINREVLGAVGPKISQKVATFINGYISELPAL